MLLQRLRGVKGLHHIVRSYPLCASVGLPGRSSWCVGYRLQPAVEFSHFRSDGFGRCLKSFDAPSWLTRPFWCPIPSWWRWRWTSWCPFCLDPGCASRQTLRVWWTPRFASDLLRPLRFRVAHKCHPAHHQHHSRVSNCCRSCPDRQYFDVHLILPQDLFMSHIKVTLQCHPARPHHSLFTSICLISIHAQIQSESSASQPNFRWSPNKHCDFSCRSD